MLRKSNKKNYFKFLFFKSIVLFDTLNKILKFIILKRFCYIVKIHNMLSNT